MRELVVGTSRTSRFPVNPEVSIIVPVYNAVLFLEQCLKSIERQTLGCFEAILVDDGSSDGSLAICEQFAARDSRFRVISQRNSGAAVARAEGLRQAKAPWITFLDSDDWFDISFLETLMRELRGTDLDAIVCNATQIGWPSGRILVNRVYCRSEVITGEEVIHRIMTRRGIRSELWGKVFRRELLSPQAMANGLVVGEDLVTLVQIYLARQNAKTQILPLFLYNYRISKNSIIGRERSVERATAHASVVLRLLDGADSPVTESELGVFFLRSLIDACRSTMNVPKYRQALWLSIEAKFKATRALLTSGELVFFFTLFASPNLARTLLIVRRIALEAKLLVGRSAGFVFRARTVRSILERIHHV